MAAPNVMAIKVIETKSPVIAIRSVRRISQGATITEKYFLYADWVENSSQTIIYRCKRSGNKISGCKKLIQGNFIHANTLGHKWGTNYFSIFNCGNPNGGASWWCYDLDGNRASKSKCKPLPKFNTNTSGVKGGRGMPQGNAQYGDYFLKGYSSNASSNKNKILIYKKGRATPIVQLNVGYNYTELEDVFVDGDTGVVYFTTSSGAKNIVRLHKTNYKLPKFSDLNEKTAKKTLKTTTTGDQPGKTVNPSTSTKTKTETEASEKATPKASEPQSAQTETAILQSKSIDELLQLIVDIMTIGIPLLGIIGIAVVGIQYLTAGADETKTKKAKRRLLEIIIGLILYAVLFVVLRWLGVGN